MGIQGLFKELEPQSRRIALSKYALDHYTATSRRLRIAVDASIWSFQVQGGKGGHNPALRTLYYRLVRLLSLNINPLFVFDGKKRPAFKRGRKTNVHLTPSLIQLCKKLLRMFGIPFHTAPGEAEAECALLQREGIVDAVMSEDVDTLMFGATAVLRDWGPLGKGGKGGLAKTRVSTHISVYEAESIKADTGLDRSGMVLIALMHGGDYLPEGLPGCGIKTAIEAAAAGFGEELSALKVDDEEGIREWREKLQKELATNASKRFSKKNGRVKIPEEFPRRDLWEAYYTPIVSSKEDVETIRSKIEWDKDVDVRALREYARETFEWRGTGGAAKFVRTLAPALMARWTLDGRNNVAELVESVHGVRTHCSTDECIEIRISYTPANVIHIDAEREADDDQLEAAEQRGILEDDEGDTGVGRPKAWFPDKQERIWVLEHYARRTLGEHVERWEDKKRPKSKKIPSASTLVTTATQQTTATRKKAGAEQTLDKYLTVWAGNTNHSEGPGAEGLVERDRREKEPRKAAKATTKRGEQDGNIRSMFTKVTKANTVAARTEATDGRKPETSQKLPHKKFRSRSTSSDNESSSSPPQQPEPPQRPSRPPPSIPNRLPSRDISSSDDDELPALQQRKHTAAKSSDPPKSSSSRSNNIPVRNDHIPSDDDELPSLHQLIISSPRKPKSSRPQPLPHLPASSTDSDPDEPPIKARQRLMRRRRTQKPAVATSGDDEEEDSDTMDPSQISLHRPFYEEVQRPSTPPSRATRNSHTANEEGGSPTEKVRRRLDAIDLTQDSPEPASKRGAPPEGVLTSTRVDVAVIESVVMSKDVSAGNVIPTTKKKSRILVLDLTNEP